MGKDQGAGTKARGGRGDEFHGGRHPTSRGGGKSRGQLTQRGDSSDTKTFCTGSSTETLGSRRGGGRKRAQVAQNDGCYDAPNP